MWKSQDQAGLTSGLKYSQLILSTLQVTSSSSKLELVLVLGTQKLHSASTESFSLQKLYQRKPSECITFSCLFLFW